MTRLPDKLTENPQPEPSSGAQAPVTLREMALEDYDEVITLWRASEGIGLSAADSCEAIARYLARNPGMSFVACAEDGELVGAVLCGHDGRRGYLHHLAVRYDQRGQGVGGKLVERCLAALRSAGIDKCHLFVKHDNVGGQEFWKKAGWSERANLVMMSKDIEL